MFLASKFTKVTTFYDSTIGPLSSKNFPIIGINIRQEILKLVMNEIYNQHHNITVLS
jgi:hypothetical protein